MIVYLYVHLPTEMGYVGSTERALEERFEAHWKKARKKSKGSLHALMARADRVKSDWLRVTLEEYDDLEEMLRGEVEWMLELETVRPKVGFNSQVPSEQDIQARLNAAPQRKRADMAAEELEFYREQGTIGATTHDTAAAGRLGAIAKWSKPGEKARASEACRSWWSRLTPAEQEAHRERGRQEGVKGGAFRPEK